MAHKNAMFNKKYLCLVASLILSKTHCMSTPSYLNLIQGSTILNTYRKVAKLPIQYKVSGLATVGGLALYHYLSKNNKPTRVGSSVPNNIWSYIPGHSLLPHLKHITGRFRKGLGQEYSPISPSLTSEQPFFTFGWFSRYYVKDQVQVTFMNANNEQKTMQGTIETITFLLSTNTYSIQLTNNANGQTQPRKPGEATGVYFTSDKIITIKKLTGFFKGLLY